MSGPPLGQIKKCFTNRLVGRVPQPVICAKVFDHLELLSWDSDKHVAKDLSCGDL